MHILSTMYVLVYTYRYLMDFFAKTLRLPGKWANNVRFSVSSAGDFSAIKINTSAGDAEIIDGVVIPGMPNLHSHSFQRAMVGMAEYRQSENDDFWSWRKLMYQCVNRINPDQLQAITAQLYVEMLKAGYTSVAEFHYLHHQQNGKVFDTLTSLSDVIVEAAVDSGLGLTLLPTLYQTSGFGDKNPVQDQRRFINNIDQFGQLVEQLLRLRSSQIQIGLAAHSLRAIEQGALADLLALKNKIGAATPLHIHIAEQEQEVSDCIEHYACRPIEWLYDNYDVNDSWTLIHATHVTDHELQLLARSKCIVGLCPTTEANLADGVFPIKDFLDLGGLIGIGSDSHISVNPIEELRWLEYGQRLQHEKRVRLIDEDKVNNGTYLWELVSRGGALACGRPIGHIEVDKRADLLVLDEDHPILYGKQIEHVLDTLIFAGNTNIIKDVMVGGKWLVKQQRHINEDSIKKNFYEAMDSLFKAQ
jgi:formimidoylglutamate deiminase